MRECAAVWAVSSAAQVPLLLCVAPVAVAQHRGIVHHSKDLEEGGGSVSNGRHVLCTTAMHLACLFPPTP